jgi:hypothetical protein
MFRPFTPLIFLEIGTLTPPQDRGRRGPPGSHLLPNSQCGSFAEPVTSGIWEILLSRRGQVYNNRENKMRLYPLHRPSRTIRTMSSSRFVSTLASSRAPASLRSSVLKCAADRLALDPRSPRVHGPNALHQERWRHVPENDPQQRGIGRHSEGRPSSGPGRSRRLHHSLSLS